MYRKNNIKVLGAIPITQSMVFYEVFLYLKKIAPGCLNKGEIPLTTRTFFCIYIVYHREQFKKFQRNKNNKSVRLP